LKCKRYLYKIINEFLKVILLKKVRSSRISEEIKKEVSLIIQSELKDPRIGFITVVAVEITNDLQIAKIYISIMGTEENKAETITALNKAKGYIRSELGKRIRLRVTPEINFVIDNSIEYGNKIDKILDDIFKNNEGKI